MINFPKKKSHFLTNSRLHVTMTSRSTNSHVILPIIPIYDDEHDVRVAPVKNNLGLDNGQCTLGGPTVTAQSSGHCPHEYGSLV